MRKIIAALLAASALAPVAASAQDREGRPDGPGMDRRAEMREMRRAESPAPGAQDERRGRDEWRQMREERREMQPGMPEPPRVERPAPVAPAPQSFDRQARGEWRGDRDQRWGGDRAPPPRPDQAAGRDRPDRGDWRNQPRPDWRAGRADERPGWQGGNRPDWRGDRPDLRPDRRDERAEFDRRQRRDDQWNDRRGDNRGWGGDRWNGGGWRGDQAGWDRDWRRDRRYDWSGFRSHNERLYRLPRYYAPPGWGYGYRRFSIGVTLAPQLWGQGYWLDDPWSYRLPEAYGPYRWVRYFDDAMLVDIRTGRVVDVVYDIFY